MESVLFATVLYAISSALMCISALCLHRSAGRRPRSYWLGRKSHWRGPIAWCWWKITIQPTDNIGSALRQFWGCIGWWAMDGELLEFYRSCLGGLEIFFIMHLHRIGTNSSWECLRDQALKTDFCLKGKIYHWAHWGHWEERRKISSFFLFFSQWPQWAQW